MNRSLASTIRKPSVTAYEGLCGPRAKDVAFEGYGQSAASVGGDLEKKFYGKYLQRKNGAVGGSGGSFWWQIRRFRSAEKKAQDKGRWSQSAHPPVTPARNAGRAKGLRDFPSPPTWVVGFEDFQIQGGRWDKKSSVPKRLRCVGLRSRFFPSESSNLASLYQRKGLREIAARGVLNKLITRPFCPGYSPQIGVLCVAE